jgi:hypothetical protein
MSWYSIDAVDSALNRTKSSLIEPFDFWKWLKLGIIIFFIGGGWAAGPNFGGTGQDFTKDEFADFPALPPIDSIGLFLDQYMIFILIIAALIVGILLLFVYVSNLMEFVFVESLVTNIVAFWAYSRKYMRLGFNLFIIRLILSLAFLLLFIIAMLPMIESFDTTRPEMIIGGILWGIAVIFVLFVVDGIIQSFINLSIPLVMYHDMGIIAAFKKVLINVKADWKQIIVYWLARFILRLAASIILFIAAFLLFLIIFGVLFILDVALYFILNGTGQGIDSAVFWVVMIPVLTAEFILFIVFMLMTSVPVPVFMKYHMLTFLQAWYPEARIPFYDVHP